MAKDWLIPWQFVSRRKNPSILDTRGLSYAYRGYWKLVEYEVSFTISAGRIMARLSRYPHRSGSGSQRLLSVPTDGRLSLFEAKAVVFPWAESSIISPLERLGALAEENPKVEWVQDRRGWSREIEGEVYTARLPDASKYEHWQLTVVRKPMGIGVFLRGPRGEFFGERIFPPPRTKREQNQAIFAWARSQMFDPLVLLAELGKEL